MLWWSISADMLTFEISRYFARSRQSLVDSSHKRPMPGASNSELDVVVVTLNKLLKEEFKLSVIWDALTFMWRHSMFIAQLTGSDHGERKITKKPKLPITDFPNEKENTSGTLYEKSSTKIKSWICNNLTDLMWDIITHPRPNFNGGLVKPPLKLGHGWVITSRSFTTGSCGISSWNTSH